MRPPTRLGSTKYLEWRKQISILITEKVQELRTELILHNILKEDQNLTVTFFAKNKKAIDSYFENKTQEIFL